MNEHDTTDKVIQLIARLSVDKSSQVLSKMVRNGASIEMERAYIGDITRLTEQITADYDDIVGAFIDLLGDVPCKFLFFVASPDSLALADMLLRRPVGSTTRFDQYAESAIQEIGNVLASAISNVFSADLQIAMQPSPPDVVHDFVGTVFDEFVRSVAGQPDEIMIIESIFHIQRMDMRCSMFIVPNADIDTVFKRLSAFM